jgi:lipopolysaccharide export system protein LptA
MWTPKRIILLVGWFTFFIAAYVGSSYFLGGIDGLPPLPDRFKPVAVGRETIAFPSQPEFSADKKLRMAFGDRCDELKRKFKLEVDPRGLVLASENVTIEHGEREGQALLAPFSVAIFSKDKGDGKYPDITIVQAERAYLTFEKPLKNITEMGSSKITGGELIGNISIINNRGIAGHSDDVSLSTQGPLYYDEARRHIWTKDTVKLLDLRSKPKPTTIDGVGADLYLAAAETTKSATNAAKDKNQSISGVDRVELRSNVAMHLWVDSRSGILGPTNDDPKAPKVAAKAPPPPKAGEKTPAQEDSAHVIIMTQGPFNYDFKTDKAVFETSKLAGPLPDLVTVDRSDEKTRMSDQLKCELLEIQFTRKGNAAPKAAAAASATDKLEIETVRATGKNVVLTSDAQVLEAHGNEFTYNNKTSVSVLKGKPFMYALKEGNEIRAPEFQMVNVKGAQQAYAVGAGTMNFWGANGAKKPQEARWKQSLKYAKEGDKDQLTLQGDAVFLDPEHEQELKAQTLKVLLASTENGPNQGAADAQKKPTPTQVDAIGEVTATSPDMLIHEAERLILLFKDVPPGVLPPPANAPPANGLAVGKPQEPASVGSKPGEVAGAGGKQEPLKKPRPVDLKAKFVQAQVLREGQRNELQEVWCQGAVRVLQAPEKNGENGVDIRGETLHLTHRAEGDVLEVMGTSPYAQVQMDQLFILGPEIIMDQTRNDVEVKGMGVMRMLSKQGFDGAVLAKPSEMRVEWEGRMFFDGIQATFYRDVRAAQDTGRMGCEELQVTLDRRVSLKEGAKGEQPAVEKLVCHNHVALEDTKREGIKIVDFKRISAPELAVDNDKDSKERVVMASGHGLVRLFQLGSKQEALDGPKKQANPKATQTQGKDGPQKDEKEFKLTLIWYDGRMFANNVLGLATFYDNVTVVQLPTEDPELKVGNGVPPPGSMTLKCEKLEVLEHKQKDGVTSQEMRAYKRVYVEGDTFSASCDVMKYDSSKEQIIFEATIPGTYAKLNHQKFKGAEPYSTEARKIIYNRLTGEYSADGARMSRIQ